MDFVFDRTGEGRALKCLTIVDDATHEAVAIEVERAISGRMLTRVLDRLALSCVLPRVIRTDSGIQMTQSGETSYLPPSRPLACVRLIVLPGSYSCDLYAFVEWLHTLRNLLTEAPVVRRNK
jgi:hypothetical protein